MHFLPLVWQWLHIYETSETNTNGRRLEQSLFSLSKLVLPKELSFGEFAQYKLILAVMDIAAVCLSFYLGMLLSGYDFIGERTLSTATMIAVFSVLCLSFFTNYHLYNYHIIHAKPDHRKNVYKALAWGLLPMTMIYLIYTFPQVFFVQYFIPVLFLVALVDFCTSMGITIWFSPKLMPIIDVKLYIDNFCGVQMIRLNTRRNVWLFNKIKHIMDALLTFPLFLLLLPVFVAISLSIKLNSKGPVFYRAKAIGKGGRVYG